MGNLSSDVWLTSSRVSAANESDVKLNTRREIPYLQATMYYVVYNGNWTERSAIWAEIIRVISKSNRRIAWVCFEITRMISDQNCTTRGSITTLLHPFWNHPNIFLMQYWAGLKLNSSNFFLGGGGGEVRVLVTKVAKFATWYASSFIFLQFDWLL